MEDIVNIQLTKEEILFILFIQQWVVRLSGMNLISLSLRRE